MLNFEDLLIFMLTSSKDYLLKINLCSIMKYIYSVEIIYGSFFDIFFNMMILGRVRLRSEEGENPTYNKV